MQCWLLFYFCFVRVYYRYYIVTLRRRLRKIHRKTYFLYFVRTSASSVKVFSIGYSAESGKIPNFTKTWPYVKYFRGVSKRYFYCTLSKRVQLCDPSHTSVLSVDREISRQAAASVFFSPLILGTRKRRRPCRHWKTKWLKNIGALIFFHRIWRVRKWPLEKKNHSFDFMTLVARRTTRTEFYSLGTRLRDVHELNPPTRYDPNLYRLLANSWQIYSRN